MKNKWLALLLALVMLFSLTLPALAAEETGSAAWTVPADVAGKLVILHTNDTHGADVAVAGKSIGTAGVAQLKKDFEAAGAQVLLFSAGDAIQDDPVVNTDYGASAIKFMEAAGYDAMALGNHEFDWGYANLVEIMENGDFPVLAANIVDKETGSPIFEGHTVFTTADGLKVGVFGLDTPETATKTNPKNIATITFKGLFDVQELYDCAAAEVAALKAEDVDLVVCLGHLGVSAESEPYRSIDLIRKVPGIDLFIDGHSHSTNADINAAIGEGADNRVDDTLLVSTGTKLARVGVVIYDKAAGTLTNSYVTAAEYSRVDDTVNAMVNARKAEVDQQLAAVIGKTEVVLNGNRAPGVRTEETNLGDFACDAILWQARQELGEDAVDAAFTNGGGIRATIPVGDISLNIMKTVFPYGNTVATVDLTGAQLLEMLEANTCSTPGEIGGFPQVSGIVYTVDTTVPYENGTQYPGTTYYAPAKPGSRVTVSSVNGKPWDANATYTLATNNFTAAGGDAYYVLTQGSNLYESVTSLEDALTNYAREVLGGTITAKDYGTTASNITVKVAPPTYTVVKGDNLSKIALGLWGDMRLWKLLYEANKSIIKNPNLIFIGQVLTIPER